MLSFQQIIKLKAEARLDLLRQIGVSVDTWVKSAMNQVMEELENERWASLPTMINNGSSHLVRFLHFLFAEQLIDLSIQNDSVAECGLPSPLSSPAVGIPRLLFVE